MASSGVLPWLVGLPAPDTAWDAAPAPAPAQNTTNLDPSASTAGSPQSAPGTLRHRASDAEEAGTVNRRAKSSSPAKQPSLAWRKRLIDGYTSYGDQTELFGPSGLENLFARQVTDGGNSQKEHKLRHLAPKAKLSTRQETDTTSLLPTKQPTQQNPRTTRPSTENEKPALALSIPIRGRPLLSPTRSPVALSPPEKRSSEDSADASPASQSSQSSVADMLTEMMGKIDQLSESNKSYQSRMQVLKERYADEEMKDKMDALTGSNKGYQTRMQALKERFGESEEWRQKLEKSEREKLEATTSAERRVELAKSERRRLADDYNMSKMRLSHMRQESNDWKQKYEEAQSKIESLRSSSPNSVTRDHHATTRDNDAQSLKSEIITREAEAASPDAITGAQSPRSEIITRQPEATPVNAVHSINGVQSSPVAPKTIDTTDDAEAGAEPNAEPKHHTTYYTAQSAYEPQDATGNRSVTESELEDLTPVFIAKRTTSTGNVHFNAVRTNMAAQADILKQRKDIDKTETSQRARELELAMGAEESEIKVSNESSEDRTKVLNRVMGITDPSIADAEDESDWMGARHVSGFTDAPEVEEDMPVRSKQVAFSGTWDFTEPPFNESSELAAAHKHGESAKRSVSFGLQQLNDYAFNMADMAPDSTDITVEEADVAQQSGLSEPSKEASSRDSSPASNVQAPGSRMPFQFRKDSLAEISNMSTTAKRTSSNTSARSKRAPPITSPSSKPNSYQGSVPRSAKTPSLSLRKTRTSPSQESKEQNITDIAMAKTRSPPQVYVEDADEDQGIASPVEGKRPLPRSPLKSPTPKRRRTLHDSELQSVTDANVSYHSQLQEAISSRKRKDAREGEKHNVAKPEVLAQRKMARARSATPSQGPATKDYINEAKKVIELLRGNNTSSSPLGGITEAEEEEETYQEYEEEARSEDPPYNTHKSDNMRTLAPQQVAHLIGGEMHGMTFDKAKNCWIRVKSSEHKQFLDPRDALSSDDDPFREISDLTVEKSVRVLQHRPSQDAGATTVVHHELDNTGLSFDDAGLELHAEREDTPQQSGHLKHQTPKLPGEDTTWRHFEDVHDSDPTEITPTTEISTQAQQPSQTRQPSLLKKDMHVDSAPPSEGATPTTDISTCAPLPSQIMFPSSPNRDMPVEVAGFQLATTNSNSNINNTFLLSDLPEFTVHEEDHPRPSERALATRLAQYASVEAGDPYTVATTELVKAITDVQGKNIYWDDVTSLCLADKSLKTLHNLNEHCERVEKLDVSSNALTQLDGVPPFVRQLNARFNQLVSLTSWDHLMHLQYLDISSNNLESLDGLSHLIHLRELRVDDNSIRRLDGIADLDGLITLSARNNAICEVKLEQFKFGRVVELDLSENKITNIQGIDSMESLRTLKLDKNPLGDIDIGSGAHRLRHLSLRSCSLNDLSVTGIPNLRSLDVDDNSLSKIVGLGMLKKLDLLSMCAQNLKEGEHIDIFNAGGLEAQTIRLARNTIPDLRLPDVCFPSVKHLEHAFLSVKHLDLSDTGLAYLPPSFGVQLRNLRSLDLSYNGIKDIRPLAPLMELRTLSLVGCRVDRLRKTVSTFGKMRRLLDVDLRNNPLTQGFYGPEGSDDKVYKRKLDEDTAIRRRTYELCMAYMCENRGFVLDGQKFDNEAARVKDHVWDRLTELGVLRRII